MTPLNIFLTEEEIAALTGYRVPNLQVGMLHKLGFTRAHKNARGKVILERAHFEAVAQGVFIKKSDTAQPAGVDVSFMRGRA